MAHRAQIIQLDQTTELARHLAGDDVHEVHMRMKSRKNFGGVFGRSHRAYLPGCGTPSVNGKGQGTAAWRGANGWDRLAVDVEVADRRSRLRHARLAGLGARGRFARRKSALAPAPWLVLDELGSHRVEPPSRRGARGGPGGVDTHRGRALGLGSQAPRRFAPRGAQPDGAERGASSRCSPASAKSSFFAAF